MKMQEVVYKELVMANNDSMKPKYRIRITTLAGEAFVSRLPRWDGAWFNSDESAAKTWSIKAWADKWLDERPAVTGTVELV